MRNDKVIYKLTIEDIQYTAEDDIGRKLTDEEIKKILPDIEKNITWNDAISIAIMNHIDCLNKVEEE